MKDESASCWRRIGVYGGDHSCERLSEAIHCRNCEVFHVAARGMFARESMPERPEAVGRALHDDVDERSVLVFRIGSQWLGLPTAQLAEVAPDRPIRRLAHRTSGKLEGAVNVRGELHLCVSLAEMLGLTRREMQGGETSRLILLRDPTGALLAFRSDEVRGLQHFTPDQVEAAPDTLGDALKRCVEGLIPGEGGHVALLKDGAVIDALEEALFQ